MFTLTIWTVGVLFARDSIANPFHTHSYGGSPPLLHA